MINFYYCYLGFLQRKNIKNTVLMKFYKLLKIIKEFKYKWRKNVY